MKNKKSRYYYKMCKKQFEEMKEFYLGIGYSEKQADKLCSSCFGADIVVDDDIVYSKNWVFRRTMKPRPIPEGGGFFGGKKGARNSYPGGMVLEEARMMSPLPPSMAGGPPVMSAAPMPMAADAFQVTAAVPSFTLENLSEASIPTDEPEWNTAETHNAPEVEEESTLDRPQIIFSANVNTASWSYLRGKIARNKVIDKDFVRIEEIINSYKYKMKPPKDGSLFSVYTEHGKCPWNKDNELLMIGLKGKKAEQDVHQNLAFLVDVSGSMEDNWVIVQMSLAAVMSKLKKGDHMSVISYSDTTTTVVEKMNCGDLGSCVKAILSIDGIGGCTRGSEGLEQAYKYISDNYDKDANNRVFVFTDGDFNFGITSEGGLSDFIYKKRKTGIYLSIVGFGYDNFKDNKMEALAKNGNGNYTFVSNPADITDYLWDKLISNLVTIAKDVKISVEINPLYAKKYRLIGYDARLLTRQEFNDTEKAADGIGSGHNVVALIEFTRGKSQQRYTSRYTGTEIVEHNDEFAFMEIHYKTPEGKDKVMTYSIPVFENTEEGKNMPVISLLAAFGLVVKNSDYKGTADKELLRELLANIEEKKKDSSPYSHINIIKSFAAQS